jgi:catechol 2,3-dioxygenase-like lactoylglutathione lyase family enzyme
MSSLLIPELDVDDLDASLDFYVTVLGFAVLYDRPEERFAFLAREQVHLMLQEAVGPGRRFRTAILEHPYGRGVNFQIQIADVAQLYDTVCMHGCAIVIPLEERWYRISEQVVTGNRQFVLADPDGYLLRFFSELGRRTVDANSEDEHNEHSRCSIDTSKE